MPDHIRRLRDTLRTRFGGPSESDVVVGAPGSIQLRNVTAGYGSTPVFSRFDLHIDPGEFVYLVGPSGSGKSTLLKVLFGTVRADEGWVNVDGIAVHRLQHWQTDTIRRRVGCVFQTYELLSHLTALENVLLPLQLAHPRTRHARNLATEALELVGLRDKLHALPPTLSGGQQQRVAVARAIAHQPRVLLADEPTGNVDKDASAEIMELFGQLNEHLGSTIVMATHDEYVLSRYPARAVRLQTPILEVVAS
ncbi:MAG TPA: ATP-binding cassette domain-containing protein [Terriglobales bacterium]|nr:ATP-binding cassette domain-containing protein [Terriglobales bacterium]